MKNKILFHVFFLFSLTLISQTVPHFQNEFYFEDAVGNKDTLVFKTHIDADQNLDADLGEVFDNSPFDSIFEVRAVYDFYEPGASYANPIVVRAAETGGTWQCDTFKMGFFYIIMSLKYPPVTISWDKEIYNDVCGANAYLSPVETDLLEDPNWINWEFLPKACLFDDDSYTFDFAYQSYGADFLAEDLHLNTPAVLNNGVQDTLRGIQYSGSMQGSFSPCQFFVSSTEENNNNTSVKIKLFPNPTTTEISLELPAEIEANQVEIYSVSGQRMNLSLLSQSSQNISVAHFPPGIYFLRVDDKQGKIIGTEKFVKL